MANLNLSRQNRIISGDIVSQWAIKIFGVGSIGSHVAKVLAKTGFKDIELYDMDIVEEENLSAQAFDFKHLKMNKVDAMKEILMESAGVEAVAHHGQVTKDTLIDAEPNTIYCCFFDSFEGRQMIFNMLKEMPIIFVDGRIGALNMRHYLIDCTNPEEVKLFEKSLGTTATSELECGEKACAPVNTELAGKITSNIINYISGRDYINPFMGCTTHPQNDLVIVKKGTGVEETPEVTTEETPTEEAI